MLISTKKGDQGYTDIRNERVAKNDARICALGAIDEAIAFILQADLKCDIPYSKNIVDNLSCIAAEIAGYNSNFDAHLICELERVIIEKEGQFAFIYPFKNEEKILLNLCRVKVRSLERELISLENLKSDRLRFINRLSDYYFVKML